MDGRPRLVRPLAASLTLSLCLSGLACRPEHSAAPPPKETLARAGERLSRDLSPGELSRIAARGDLVLPRLTAREREELSRGTLAFHVDRPTVVRLAAPSATPPFWLAQRGFRPLAGSFRVAGQPWSIHELRVPEGPVELGVNALDRRPSAHYVVFLSDDTGRPVVPSRVAGTTGQWDAVEAAPRASLAAGIDLTPDKFPDSLAGSVMLRPQHDARHSALLAKGRVWKTHVVAGPAPDQVKVAFGPDAGRELVWSWRTDVNTRRSVLRLKPARGGVPTEVPGTSEVLETPDVLNDPAVRLHAARAAGLDPSTTYAYSVGDGTEAGSTPWTPVNTAPRVGSDAHLLYMGDPQCGLEDWGKLLADARRRRPDAGVLLIAGDLVDRGNERTNWDHFFLRAGGVFERLPVMPAVGNHEYLDRGPWLYSKFFKLPANGPAGEDRGLVYSFEYGDVFVAVLDSTRALFSPVEAGRQARWLDDALAATAARWKLVMFHHPVYASHISRENPAIRDAWVPTFDRRRVDLVLQGHDHSYMRTYPLRQGRQVPDGTVYVVSVSGDKFYEQDTRGMAEVGFTHVATYQTIDTDAANARLTYRAWDASGRERDRFELSRAGAVTKLARGYSAGRDAISAGR